jgi:hypothetical protein
VGLAFTVTSAFAFWREVTVKTEVEIVTLGSPIEILVTDLNQLNDDLRLVPKGYAMAVGDVELIELSYDIGVSRELLNQVTLQVLIEDILIDGNDTYSHLVKIEVMGEEGGVELDLYNETITITIIVEILEPIDLEEALEDGLDLDLVNVENSVEANDSIQGKNITFAIALELKQKEVTE